MVNGKEGTDDGTKLPKDNGNNEEIIDGDRAAEWEDFKANIWRMLPHPQRCQQQQR